MDFRVDEQQAESEIFRTVLFYVFLILFVPVAAFFGSRTFLFGMMFGMETTTSTLYAAVVTVVVIHAMLGLYVMRAFREAEKGPKKD